ncbi:MAG: hypothetical protein WKF40_09345, partial [Thermoleophilaceae bacterium]
EEDTTYPLSVTLRPGLLPAPAGSFTTRCWTTRSRWPSSNRVGCASTCASPGAVGGRSSPGT